MSIKGFVCVCGGGAVDKNLVFWGVFFRREKENVTSLFIFVLGFRTLKLRTLAFGAD